MTAKLMSSSLVAILRLQSIVLVGGECSVFRWICSEGLPSCLPGKNRGGGSFVLGVD